MKNKNSILSALILTAMLIPAISPAEDAPASFGWEKKAVGTLNFTQNSFDNWSQGGEDSWTWMLNINAGFNRSAQTYTWNNSVKIAYGDTKVGSQGSRKAADEISLESVYTRLLGTTINPYVAVTAKTQFSKGYDYGDAVDTPISDFMDPGYFTQSLGIGFEPNDKFKTRMGAAVKETVSKDYGYADDPDTEEIETSKTEYGAESVTDLKLTVMENILFTSKLELFSNLKKFEQTDVTWDNLFTASISKYITVSFNIKIYYDRDISRIRQLQQTLAVGLTYNLF